MIPPKIFTRIALTFGYYQSVIDCRDTDYSYCRSAQRLSDTGDRKSFASGSAKSDFITYSASLTCSGTVNQSSGTNCSAGLAFDSSFTSNRIIPAHPITEYVCSITIAVPQPCDAGSAKSISIS
jgi:hypothetical protein